jgi:uncharacterized membrane protein
MIIMNIFLAVFIIVFFIVFSRVQKANAEAHATKQKQETQRKATDSQLAFAAKQAIEDAVIVIKVERSACGTGYYATYFNADDKRITKPVNLAI